MISRVRIPRNIIINAIGKAGYQNDLTPLLLILITSFGSVFGRQINQGYYRKKTNWKLQFLLLTYGSHDRPPAPVGLSIGDNFACGWEMKLFKLLRMEEYRYLMVSLDNE